MAQVFPKALNKIACIHGYTGAAALMLIADIDHKRTVDILQGAKPTDAEVESIAKLVDISPSSLMYFYYDDNEVPTNAHRKFRKVSIKVLMYVLTKWM